VVGTNLATTTGRHPGERRDPVLRLFDQRVTIRPCCEGPARSVHTLPFEQWVPAFAGMTAGG